MKTILFCGGGTAGHVMPNLALIEALSGKYTCVYAGGDGMEKELCDKRGIPFFRIDTVKLRRDAFFKNLSVPFKLCACKKSAAAVIDKVKPALIFSKGGFAALPLVLAAKHVPILAHESDITPGIVTKLSKNKAAAVLCTFEPCAAKFKNGVHVGTPLSKKLYRGSKSRAALGFDGKKPVLLCMGGSSGAAALNGAIADALPILLKRFDVVHITGRNKKGAPPTQGYKPIEFCDGMADMYAAADIVLTRGGAGSLFELAALGKPALVVPLEKASRGDQIKNAEYFAQKNAAIVLREHDINTDSLVAAIEKTFSSRDALSAAMKTLHADGTDKICEIIDRTIGQ